LPGWIDRWFATIFATELLNTGQDRAVSDGQGWSPKSNEMNQIQINRDNSGQRAANCKTVYTSSILVVASTNIINNLR
jgi:hypothetical protein